MMSVSTLFVGLDALSCVLICLVALGIVLGLVDFHFLSSILCVLLILSRLIRTTVSVFFRTLLSCSTVILLGFILTCLNLINGNGDHKPSVVVVVVIGHLRMPNGDRSHVSSTLYCLFTCILVIKARSNGC